MANLSRGNLQSLSMFYGYDLHSGPEARDPDPFFAGTSEDSLEQHRNTKTPTSMWT